MCTEDVMFSWYVYLDQFCPDDDDARRSQEICFYNSSMDVKFFAICQFIGNSQFLKVIRWKQKNKNKKLTSIGFYKTLTKNKLWCVPGMQGSVSNKSGSMKND